MESLIGAVIGFGQISCSGWDFKSIAVPLEDREEIFKAFEQRVFDAAGSQLDVTGADFFLGVGINFGAESQSQHLSAEADSQIGFFLIDGLIGKIEEPCQKVVLFVSGDGKGAAQINYSADID